MNGKHIKYVAPFCLADWVRRWIKYVNSYLRQPDIGFVFRSSIVNPHRPIDANIHDTNNNMMSTNNLHGATNIVNTAVCGIEEDWKKSTFTFELNEIAYSLDK